MIELLPKLIRDLGSEGIYSIALYYSGDGWDYLSPTVSTYKGLEQVALSYKEKERYAHRSLESLRNDLKWSPCDSPLHGKYESSLLETEKLLGPIRKLMDDLYDEENDDWSKVMDVHRSLISACLQVLSRLDKEGFFSEGRIQPR
jgi:hypothetical protein